MTHGTIRDHATDPAHNSGARLQFGAPIPERFSSDSSSHLSGRSLRVLVAADFELRSKSNSFKIIAINFH